MPHPIHYLRPTKESLYQLGLFLLFLLFLGIGLFTDYTETNGVPLYKEIYFLFLTGFCLITVAGYNWFEPRISRFNKIDALLLLLFVYQVISGIVNGDSLLKNTQAIQMGLAVTYFLFRILIFKFSPSHIVWLLLLYAALQITLAICQWFGFISSGNLFFRFTGGFVNPSPFTILLASLLVFCMAVFFYSGDRILKYVTLTVFFTGLPLILISFSRSAFIALSVGTFFVLVFQPRLRKILSGIKTSTFIFSLCILTICLLPLGKWLYLHKKDSADGRLLVWKISTHIIANNPVWGVGANKFKVSFSKYQAEYFRGNPPKIASEGKNADQVLFAFNDLFQLVTEYGLLSGVVAILLSIQVFRDAKQLNMINLDFKYNIEPGLYIGVLGALISLIIGGLFSYPLATLTIKVFFLFLLATLSVWTNLDIKTSSEKISILSAAVHIQKIMFILIGLAFMTYSYFYYRGVQFLRFAALHTEEIHLLRKFNTYRSVLGNDENFIFIKSDLLIKHGRFQSAIQHLEEAKKNTTSRKIYLRLGDLYNQIGEQQKAQHHYELAYYVAPKYLEPKYILAKFYLHTGQFVKWDLISEQILNQPINTYSHHVNMMIEDIKQQKDSLQRLRDLEKKME